MDGEIVLREETYEEQINPQSIPEEFKENSSMPAIKYTSHSNDSVVSLEGLDSQISVLDIDKTSAEELEKIEEEEYEKNKDEIFESSEVVENAASIDELSLKSENNENCENEAEEEEEDIVENKEGISGVEEKIGVYNPGEADFSYPKYNYNFDDE
ncbi:MAG: hypothetical protein ACP5OG_03220 [Candidatus Nanoarchaeia archaeon]